VGDPARPGLSRRRDLAEDRERRLGERAPDLLGGEARLLVLDGCRHGLPLFRAPGISSSCPPPAPVGANDRGRSGPSTRRLNRSSAAFRLRSGALGHAARDPPVDRGGAPIQRRTRWIVGAGLAAAIAAGTVAAAAAAGGDDDQELTGATRDRAV